MYTSLSTSPEDANYSKFSQIIVLDKYKLSAYTQTSKAHEERDLYYFFL
jgi:hypothetical protein